MDKGQHLRILLSRYRNQTASTSKYVVALGTDLSFHVSAQTEESTTKDSTDNDGVNWNENDVTGVSYDIQIGALVGVNFGTSVGGGAAPPQEQGNTLEDFINTFSDEPIMWELAVVGGASNRTIIDSIATGYGKLSNISMNGQNRQKASYTATLNGFGPYEVAE